MNELALSGRVDNRGSNKFPRWVAFVSVAEVQTITSARRHAGQETGALGFGYGSGSDSRGRAGIHHGTQPRSLGPAGRAQGRAIGVGGGTEMVFGGDNPSEPGDPSLARREPPSILTQRGVVANLKRWVYYKAYDETPEDTWKRLTVDLPIESDMFYRWRKT